MAAGYALYGSATMLVLSLGREVNGFLLDPVRNDSFSRQLLPYVHTLNRRSASSFLRMRTCV